jgi:hypothetical protein
VQLIAEHDHLLLGAAAQELVRADFAHIPPHPIAPHGWKTYPH